MVFVKTILMMPLLGLYILSGLVQKTKGLYHNICEGVQCIIHPHKYYLLDSLYKAAPYGMGIFISGW